MVDEERSQDIEGKERGETVGVECLYSLRIREILLAQPLNPLVSCGFSVDRRGSASQAVSDV